MGQQPKRPGNINLFAQPRVKNPNGSISTVDSISVGVDDGELLLPTVTPDGRHFTGTRESVAQQAFAEYRKTGRHLGLFPDVNSANAAAQALHEAYTRGDYDVPLASSRRPIQTDRLIAGLQRLLRRR